MEYIQFEVEFDLNVSPNDDIKEEIKNQMFPSISIEKDNKFILEVK